MWFIIFYKALRCPLLVSPLGTFFHGYWYMLPKMPPFVQFHVGTPSWITVFGFPPVRCPDEGRRKQCEEDRLILWEEKYSPPVLVIRFWGGVALKCPVCFLGMSLKYPLCFLGMALRCPCVFLGMALRCPLCSIFVKSSFLVFFLGVKVSPVAVFWWR